MTRFTITAFTALTVLASTSAFASDFKPTTADATVTPHRVTADAKAGSPTHTKAPSSHYSVKVGGNLVQATAVGTALNAAIGDHSDAETQIGTIRNTKVGGNVAQATAVGESVNVAVGQYADADTRIGTVNGAEVHGNLAQATAVRKSVNAAVGKGADACLNIGGIGYDYDC